MNKDELKRRTKMFAIKIIQLTESLPKRRTAEIINGQLLRSGTSVGANYRAACRAKSSRDFISKMGIVEEELDESMYWMELLVESGILEHGKTTDLVKESNELLAITVSSIKTARRKEMNSKFFLRNPQSPLISSKSEHGDKSAIRNEKGMALVIIVAIIAVLSAIGISFMYTMRMEEKAAFNYMNSLKASYIAKSGIEHAAAVLKSDGRDAGFVSYDANRWGYRVDDDLTDSTFSAYVNDDDHSVNNDTAYISPYSDIVDRRDSRWIYVADDNGDTVGRYAVLIIDESSKININTAGSEEEWDNSPDDPRQGWKPFEINLRDFFYAGGDDELKYWNLPDPLGNESEAAQKLADKILTYRYGDGEPDGESGDYDFDDNTDSVILRHDGIDNDADGRIDETRDDEIEDGVLLADARDEGVDDPYEFVAWKPYYDINPPHLNYDTPFITVEEIKNVPDIGNDNYRDYKPYLTVYSSDENTTDAGFLRTNINLIKDATALYTVMYKAWEDLMNQPESITYEELKQLAAQSAVNTIDCADTDNVSTFLNVYREDSGRATEVSGDDWLRDDTKTGPDAWIDGEWKGAKITVISSGTKVKQVRTIDGNTTDRIYVKPDWDTSSNPPTNSYYHIEDRATARGVEAIRINEIMVKPAYQWEAEDLFEKDDNEPDPGSGKLGETDWYDTGLDYRGIYSETAFIPADPKTITADIEVWREDRDKEPLTYRVRALTYSTSPDSGIISQVVEIEDPPGEFTTTLTVAGSPLGEDNEWKDAKITVISEDPPGTTVKQTRRVFSNTSNTIIIKNASWNPLPSSNDYYRLAHDHSFTICLKSHAPDIELEAGDHNIGGWLLEDLGTVTIEEVGLGQIELKTSEYTNKYNRVYLDYIQLSQQPDCEYVELVNISDNDVALGGWTLATSAGWVGTIPDKTIIKARDYMVLAVDKKDNLWLMFDQEDVPTKRKDDIYFAHTWKNVSSDERAVQLQLSTAPVNIAEDAFGDTFILPGSIFTDSPLQTPVKEEDYNTNIDETITVDNTTLRDTDKTWDDDQWKGATITAKMTINVTARAPEIRQITRQIDSNTADTIKITTKWAWDGDVDPALATNYYISFAPMAVTLYKGLRDNEEIVSQVSYLPEDINRRVCYEQENGVKVYGFVALEKNDPTAGWDRNGDGIDDWWHLNTREKGFTISGEDVPGGTPGDVNSVVPDDKDLDIDVNVRNLPFATVGDIKDVSRMRIAYYGWVYNANANDLIVKGSPWEIDLKGASVLIVSGKGAGQVREILENASNRITVNEDWTTIPDVTSEYHIFFEWSKIGYFNDGEEDIYLIKRLADKITVSQKRLEAEQSTDWKKGADDWGYNDVDYGDTFLTPYYYTQLQDDADTWIWGIDQRLNTDTAIYDLYIFGRVVKDGFDSPDTVLVTVTTSDGEYGPREISFSPDDIAEFGQIKIGGGIPGEGGDTALLRLEMWKDYDKNSIYFDAVILSPEYRTYGRININTAPEVVLRALPGIDHDIATAIIDYRQDPYGYDGEFGIKDFDDDDNGIEDDIGEYNWRNSDDGPFNDIGEILNVELTNGDLAIDLDTFSKISNLITTKSKVFTIISIGQALRESEKGTVIHAGRKYEILSEKKYIVVIER